MKELLQAEDCKLPCYLGITPGKTSLRDARAILEGLGGNSLGEYKRTIDFGIEYPYVFVIAGQPGADSVTRADGSIVGIYDHISLITNNDIVQIIEMSASTAGPGVSATQALAKLREYWSRYTAREVFLQAGIPDHIYISKPDPYAIGSSLLIAYRKLGVVAKIAGTATENNICPTREAKSIVIELSLFAPTTLLRTIYDDGRVPPTDREVWLPVEGALGVSAYEFYTEAVANPGACFAPR